MNTKKSWKFPNLKGINLSKSQKVNFCCGDHHKLLETKIDGYFFSAIKSSPLRRIIFTKSKCWLFWKKRSILAFLDSIKECSKLGKQFETKKNYLKNILRLFCDSSFLHGNFTQMYPFKVSQPLENKMHSEKIVRKKFFHSLNFKLGISFCIKIGLQVRQCR